MPVPGVGLLGIGPARTTWRRWGYTYERPLTAPSGPERLRVPRDRAGDRAGSRPALLERLGVRAGVTDEGLSAERPEPGDGSSVISLTEIPEVGAKNGVCPSWAHMEKTMKTPPDRETTLGILEQIVRGERGRQLRAKVASLNSDFDRSRVDDAFQTACERAGKRCKGQTEGEVYQFLYTTMMRELNAVRNVLQREELVDWSTESRARFRRCDTSVADEVVDREAEGELVELSVGVLDDLTERQRAVAVLYSHGLQRKQIAAQLDITPRIVKRSLEQLLTSGRRRLIRMAGGGCVEGEPLVARYAFGLGSNRDIQRAQIHLATCPRCGAMYERLGFWREQVAATIPLPAVAGAHSQVAEHVAHAGGDALTVAHAPMPDAATAPRGHVASAIAHIREQAAGLYTRTVDPTPLAGARPGAVAAAIAGCLAVGSGATYCVDQNVDLGPIGRLAGISSPDHKGKEKRRAPRARAAQAPTTTETTPVVPPTPTPVATTTPTSSTTTTQAAPPPAPEDQFEPTSAQTDTSGSTATAASTPTSKPKPPADNGAPEFGGP